MKKFRMRCSLMTLLICNPVFSQEKPPENASNPLASVNNTDASYQYSDLGDDAKRSDYEIDGSYMVNPAFKLKYELHYYDTDVTGSNEQDLSSFSLKSIFFPSDLKGKLGDWNYKIAGGVELILDLGDDDKGTGTGSDQIAPLVGVAFAKDQTVVVPLIQHYIEFSGNEINTTAFRLIAIQAFPDNVWGKLDAKVPIDWENDNQLPASAEVQIGKMFTPEFGTYLDGLVGVGGDKPYEWGIGLGLRYKY